MLTLVRGLPGAGKSTVARVISFYTGAYHFEADMFHVGPDGVYRYDVTKAGEGHKWCLKKTKSVLKRGYDVVVSNTFTRVEEMRPYIDLPYPAIVIHCTGKFRTIHGVPKEVMKKMRDRWETYIGEHVFNPKG